MSITITATGMTSTLDESAGLQNSTATPMPPGLLEDSNDNDIANSALPLTFVSRLEAIQTGLGNPAIGSALSGYTGAVGNTGSNIINITSDSGAAITDVAFVGPDGAPLNGLDSGLDTLNGNNILLYTDSNNNIVLGRESGPNGQVVFALYLEETGGPPTTGAKVWSAQNVPIKNPDATNPDDLVNLLDKVFVGVNQQLEFSLANVPSGQNLFLMFTTANPTTVDDGGIVRITNPTIIATGKEPANQSTGANITTGDTINTSQAGGPTTFGTNSQMITEQEGVKFSFVTGARQNVTIPNLDQSEAKVEANIDFTAFFGARSAAFDVVQLQSGKSAQVKITAFSSDNVDEARTNFVEGYLDDTKVNISNVTVINASGAAPKVTYNADGSASIIGVEARDKITYTTTSDHNRVLVENGAALNATGNTHADFDIGGFKLLQVTTTTTEIGSKVRFEDDGPSITVTNPAPADALTVDETILATNASANFADNFSNVPTYGADGAGTVSSAYALSVKSAGVDSGLVDVASNQSVLLTVNGGVVEGHTATGNDLVFTVSVDAAGLVTLDQIRALKHLVNSDPDDAVSPSAADLIALTRTDTITDKDGDTNTGFSSINIAAALSFKDDGPSIVVSQTADADALQVDETDLTTNTSANFADNFSSVPTYGADGAGTVSSAYALSVKSAGVDSGLVDVASNQSVLLTVNGGVVEGHTATGNDLVFTVSVDAAGLVTLDQIRALKHPGNPNPDDAVSPSAADLIALTRTDTITDKDGDTNTGFSTINIAAALSFKDDGPSIVTSPVQDTNPTLNTTSWTFTGAFDYLIGADKVGPTYSGTNSDFTGLSLSGTANDELIGSPVISWNAENDNSATFDVSFTFDQDRNPATAAVPVTGSLVFNKVNDNYTFEMDALAANVDVTLGTGTGYNTYNVGGTTPSSGPSPIATGKLGDAFYIQISGFESPLSAGGNTTLISGELVNGTQAPVTLSSTALGVSGNTIQSGEAATINFFEADPKGNLGAVDYSYASNFFIKFDGYETESDDLLLVLNLVDADDPSTSTTRAIYVDQLDVYENDTNNTDLAGTKYAPIAASLDNNDALLIVEGNDYNISSGDNWVLKGLQILSNDAGLTGDAINLNRNVGDDGGSNNGNTIQEDSSTNPIKIIDAGFSSVATVPPSLDLQLNFQVSDKDGDYTDAQTIDIENPIVGSTSLLATNMGF